MTAFRMIYKEQATLEEEDDEYNYAKLFTSAQKTTLGGNVLRGCHFLDVCKANIITRKRGYIA